MDILFAVSHDWLPLNFERRIFGRNEGFNSLALHFGCHAGEKGVRYLTVLAISEVPGFVRSRTGRPVPCPDFRRDREEKRYDGFGFRHPRARWPPLRTDDLVIPERFEQGIVGTCDPDQRRIQYRDDDLFARKKYRIVFQIAKYSLGAVHQCPGPFPPHTIRTGRNQHVQWADSQCDSAGTSDFYEISSVDHHNKVRYYFVDNNANNSKGRRMDKKSCLFPDIAILPSVVIDFGNDFRQIFSTFGGI
ncbi:MAG: hypothetical protein IJQ69_07110 [Bacteroidales bacterium]|nr:hypothetical protein [Bacteroidales bacterium]